jgi:ferredoxin-NADP reductase
VLLEGGAGTNYLFNEVGEGSELLLRGPQGVFTLPDVLDKDIFLICTGTGIAPFRSMAHYIKLHNLPHKNIYLIFGCRMLKDCLYGHELKQLETQMPGFYYLPTFSRETAEKVVRTGYVHSVYEDIIQECKPEAKFFLCGWKNMIDDARAKLAGLGYDKKDVHFELYG